jgi:hypothetical protein
MVYVLTKIYSFNSAETTKQKAGHGNAKKLTFNKDSHQKMPLFGTRAIHGLEILDNIAMHNSLWKII